MPTEDDSLKGMLRREGVELARGQLTQWGLTIILPPVGAVVTFIWGATQHFPMPYLIAATALAFGGFASGMHHFSQLFFQRTPEGKLRIAANQIAKRYDGKRLAGVKFGFQYQNLAIFPLEFEVKPLAVTLGSSVNPKPERPITGTTAPLGATGVWMEAEVPVTKIMKDSVVEGVFDVEIFYGRVGKKRYKMIKKFKPTIKFGQNGDIVSAEIAEIE